MLTSDDHSGIVYFMGGMIVLVLAGVGLSLLVDNRFKFSSEKGELKREIVEGANELADLRIRFVQVSGVLTANSSHLQSDFSAFEKLRTEAASNRLVLADLRARKVQGENASQALKTKFQEYRSRYRQQTWEAARGELIGDLAVRGGRQYRSARIMKITEVGMEIQHEHGIARLQAPDLNSQLYERFQWNDEEFRRQLEAEKLRANPQAELTKNDSPGEATFSHNPKPRPISPEAIQMAAADKEERLRALRLVVKGWNSKVSRLRSDQSEAVNRASYGNQSSVPGSLETWRAKSARLNKELIRAQTELALAKANLAAVSPDDSLLRVSTQHQ